MSGAVVVLGVGMHPWGRWSGSFVEQGVYAARAALKDAGIRWRDIQFVSGAAAVRSGYPGYVAGATFANALGWQGAETSTSSAACSSGGHALANARARILAGDCDVALVVAADASPRGFLGPAPGTRPHDWDWVRFRFGMTNPAYLALWARRRMHLYGATLEDFSNVRVKNGRHGVHNQNARYRMPLSLEHVLHSQLVADPLRLFHICAVSDGGAAVILCSRKYAARVARHPVHIAAISTATPSQLDSQINMACLVGRAHDESVSTPHAAALAQQAYERSQIGPRDLSVAEVYDLSTALELDWYEHLELCKQGEAEMLLRSGAAALGGRIPVNPSGGLSCMGEVVAAQALAQVCEITWQLRGVCGRRQVAGARAGLAANIGLYGNGACIVLCR